MHEIDRFTHVLHLQGTNRPGRYNVLVDDCSLGPDGLQLITQHLASTYVACTRCGTKMMQHQMLYSMLPASTSLGCVKEVCNIEQHVVNVCGVHLT
jgi:hypothetical protein